MNIAVIGSGNMGSGLGKIWAKKGHKVIFSFSRNMEKLKELAASVPNAKAATPKEAVEQSDVVLLSVRWPNVEEAITACGPLSGKTIIDCTNPLKHDLTGLEIGHTTSAAEEIAKLAKGANVVKAFNTIFAEVYQTNSRLFGTRTTTMFYCGDDKEAKSKAEQLIRNIGFEAIDAGPLTVARCLEPLAMLMIQLRYNMRMGTNISMSLIRR